MPCTECQEETEKVNRFGYRCKKCLRITFAHAGKLGEDVRTKTRELYGASRILPSGDGRVESYGLRKETIMKIIGKDGDRHFRITPETLLEIGRIVRRYLEGESVLSISRDAGMNRSTVYRTFIVWNALTTTQRKKALKAPAPKKETPIADIPGDRPVPPESPRERFALWIHSIRSRRRA